MYIFTLKVTQYVGEQVVRSTAEIVASTLEEAKKELTAALGLEEKADITLLHTADVEAVLISKPSLIIGDQDEEEEDED